MQRYVIAVYIVLWPRVRRFACLVWGRGTARRLVVQRNMRRDVVVHAVYCYRRAAVVWSVHPIGAMVEPPGGQRTGFALLF